MPLVDQVKQRFARARDRRPLLDHVVRTFQHYSAVKGNAQAGAVTFFGFLSFFPIMALAFFAVGWASRIYDVQDQLLAAIEQILPDMVSKDGSDDTIALSDVQSAAGAAAGIGLVGVLYSGLGWLSAMRDALIAVFELPAHEQPGFLAGKAKDLVSLALIGVTLLLSVAVAGAVTGFSDAILDLVGLDAALGWVLDLLGVAVGLLANMLLFFALFRLLADPHLPSRSLWSGALLGALGFEVLKQLSAVLMSTTKDQPAFQAFGIALILLVWINYFARVVIYAASWAHTSRAARAQREQQERDQHLVEGPSLDLAAVTAASPGAVRQGAGQGLGQGAGGRDPRAAFAAGAAAMLALVAVVRRKR